MHEQDMAILHTLVTVAWADGTFTEREHQLLDALLDAFGATDAEGNALREYAKTRRTLDDVPLTELSFSDRRTALSHAVVLTWVDGEQPKEEAEYLAKLRDKLNIPSEEADKLIEAANQRAKELLHLLEADDEPS